jgi:hypothetical protein
VTDDSVDITYLAAGCAHCGQALWGLHGTRVSGWDHADPADRDRDGRHTAFPADGTVREISRAEYLTLSGRAGEARAAQDLNP